MNKIVLSLSGIFLLNLALASSSPGTPILPPKTPPQPTLNQTQSQVGSFDQDALFNQLQQKLNNLSCRTPQAKPLLACSVSDNFKSSRLTAVVHFESKVIATITSDSGINLEVKYGTIIEGYRLIKISTDNLIFKPGKHCYNCCAQIKISRNYFESWPPPPQTGVAGQDTGQVLVPKSFYNPTVKPSKAILNQTVPPITTLNR